jgi:hypothetical protein
MREDLQATLTAAWLEVGREQPSCPPRGQLAATKNREGTDVQTALRPFSIKLRHWAVFIACCHLYKAYRK